MRAFLLAAGTGTRLRPLTLEIPKCLVEIDGRTMLDIWLDNMAKAGISDVLINTHHLADQVRRHLEARPGAPKTRISHEPSLLGSAGTLRANAAFVENETDFLACYGDTLTDCDLADLVRRHHDHGGPATVALFCAPNPRQAGIATLDEDGIIVAFEEKPEKPAGDLANAGICVFAPAVLELITGDAPIDIGYHLLPKLVGSARGVEIDTFIQDIGTPESLERARRQWPQRAPH